MSGTEEPAQVYASFCFSPRPRPHSTLLVLLPSAFPTQATHTCTLTPDGSWASCSLEPETSAVFKVSCSGPCGQNTDSESGACQQGALGVAALNAEPGGGEHYQEGRVCVWGGGGGGLRLDSLSLLPNLPPSTTCSLSATPLLEQSIGSWKWSTSLPTSMGSWTAPG